MAQTVRKGNKIRSRGCTTVMTWIYIYVCGAWKNNLNSIRLKVWGCVHGFAGNECMQRTALQFADDIQDI